MRVCQPGPVELKWSITSGERRRETSFLVGAFCGPRLPRRTTLPLRMRSALCEEGARRLGVIRIVGAIVGLIRNWLAFLTGQHAVPVGFTLCLLHIDCAPCGKRAGMKLRGLRLLFGVDQGQKSTFDNRQRHIHPPIFVFPAGVVVALVRILVDEVSILKIEPMLFQV